MGLPVIWDAFRDMLCHYHYHSVTIVMVMVICPSTYLTHPIVRPWGRFMGCNLWVLGINVAGLCSYLLSYRIHVSCNIWIRVKHNGVTEHLYLVGAMMSLNETLPQCGSYLTVFVPCANKRRAHNLENFSSYMQDKQKRNRTNFRMHLNVLLAYFVMG